jgi:hypothetical protein
VVKLHEGRNLWVNQGNDVATATPIATIRSTERFKFFTHDGCTAVATIATLRVDCCLIDECRHQLTCLSVHVTKKTGPNGPAFNGKIFLEKICVRDKFSELHSKDNVDNSATACGAKLNNSGGQCEQCVVLATSNVVSGVKVGSTLAYDDFACINFLTAETLYAKALGITVASVTGAGCTLLMCHGSLPCRNVGDLNLGQFRAMALTTTVAGLVLELKNVDLHAAMMVNDLRGYRDLGKGCNVTGDFAIFNEEHCRKFIC